MSNSPHPPFLSLTPAFPLPQVGYAGFTTGLAAIYYQLQQVYYAGTASQEEVNLLNQYAAAAHRSELEHFEFAQRRWAPVLVDSNALQVESAYRGIPTKRVLEDAVGVANLPVQDAVKTRKTRKDKGIKRGPRTTSPVNSQVATLSIAPSNDIIDAFASSKGANPARTLLPVSTIENPVRTKPAGKKPKVKVLKLGDGVVETFPTSEFPLPYYQTLHRPDRSLTHGFQASMSYARWLN